MICYDLVLVTYKLFNDIKIVNINLFCFLDQERNFTRKENFFQCVPNKAMLFLLMCLCCYKNC